MFQEYKVAVFYQYYERNELYRDNLIFFLAKAYLPEVDFYIILSSKCSVKLPKVSNIKYITAENKNDDFSGVVQGIRSIDKDVDYDFYFFIISSTRGPFLPSSFDGTWIDYFLKYFNKNVHLVGSSISILDVNTPESKKFKELYPLFKEPFTHIQTNSFALSSEAFHFLKNIGFYNDDKKLNKTEIISKYEIRLSQEILKKGWEIKCFLPEYNNINLHSNNINIDHLLSYEGVINKDVYFERTIHPTELIFVKVNRDILSEVELYSHTYTSLLLINNNNFKSWTEPQKLKNKSLSKLLIFKKNRQRKKKSLYYRVIKYIKKNLFD